MIHSKGFFAAFLICLLFTWATTEVHAQTNKVARITLEDGKKYTNSTFIKVSFELVKPSTKGFIDQMQLSEDPSFAKAKWHPFKMDGISYQVTGGDGLKKIHLRFKDKAGNVSPSDYATVVIDRQSPVGSLKINDGNEYTNDHQGRVILQLESSEASRIYLSNHDNPLSVKPMAMEKVMRWNLDANSDGIKSVYAILEDRAGNRSELLKASIQLDRQAPTGGELIINDGQEVTNDQEVRLKIKAMDLDMIRLVDHEVAEVLKFKPSSSGYMELDWKLKGEDGLKKIAVFFMDKAKNRTTSPVVAEIKLDRKGPEVVTFKINGGERYASSPKGQVDLGIVVKEPSNVKHLEISNDAMFAVSNTFPYQAKIPWELEASEDGVKTVYVRLTDLLGNVSDVYQTKIFLKRTYPKGLRIQVQKGEEYIAKREVSVHMKAIDAKFMQVSESPSFNNSAEWLPYETRTLLTLSAEDGPKTVFARFKDEVGNVSEPISTKVILDQTPPEGSLVVNGGEPFVTAKDKVTALNITAGADAQAMRISNINDFTRSPWRPVLEEVRPWILAGDDGLKNVYLQLRDKAGNISETIVGSVTLDRSKPTKVVFRLNDGSKWHNSMEPKVKVSLEVEGAHEMMLSNDETFAGAKWQPYKSEVYYTLPKGEGMKMVYAKFRNKAKITTDPVYARIMRDTKAPVIQEVKVNNDVFYVTARDRRIPVEVKADGANFVCISGQALTQSELEDRSVWKNYEPLSSWTLSDAEGEQEIYVYCRDYAGNISKPVQKKVSLVTTQVEVASFKINNGQKYTNKEDKAVELNFDVKEADEMMISNWEHFANAKWEPFQSTKTIKLDGGDGVKTVFAKFRNKAKVETPSYFGRIILDREAPVQCRVQLNNDSTFTTHPERKVKVKLRALGAKYMMVSEHKSFDNAKWEPYNSRMVYQFKGPDGEKTLYAKFKDEPGNESAIVSASIYSDVTPPEGVNFVINNGAKYTNDSKKSVVLKIQANKARQMMIDYSPSFSKGKWEPYREEKKIELPGGDGEKVLYIKFRDEAGNESKLMTSKILLKRSFN
ncbi:hypothetical protein [Persicobacter psychrovividus]|uniref:Ig-like domain-containing protein n=1 Tax=Persicobacter psychrovividus TaxID=387638 RepID=A0ABM7VBW4_9BACT|nr:hypothetical protein PEPS_06980 [Persicobacter psychrovividus]